MEFDTGYRLSPQTSKQGSARFTSGYLEFYIAALPGVQGAIDDFTFEIAVRAEEDLRQHSVSNPANSGDSYIDVEKDELDRLVSLNDERGQGAAMSIEYGHGPYDVVNAKGEVLYHVKASEPTWILHNATNLRKKPRKTRVKRIVMRGGKKR